MPVASVGEIHGYPYPCLDTGGCSVQKKRILFICTHNSARSQMAEGLVNALHGDKLEAFSAGTEATRVNPFAIEVMPGSGSRKR